jgi:hypothetical protein
MGYWTGGEIRMNCNEKPLRPSRGWVVLRTGALAILAGLRAGKEAGEGNREGGSSGLDSGPVYDVYGDVRPSVKCSSILQATYKEPINS